MDRKIFFSYGTVGLLSEASYKAASEFLEEYYRIGPPEVLWKYEPLTKELAKEASILLNCAQEEIVTIKNTTEGIIIASDALPLVPGDEIIVCGNEYPANLLPWLKKRKDGMTVTVIEGTDNKEVFQSLLQKVGPKTKAISISSGQYYDGFMPDIAALSKVCAEKNIFLIVDAVQTVGIREIDLAKIRVDFLICGGQKYLGSMGGLGFMYVNKKVMPQLKDTKVGIRSVKGFTPDGYELKDTAERFEDGTQNLLGIVALHAALKAVNAAGIKNIEKKNLELLQSFKEILRENNIPFIDHNRESNIISLKIDQPMLLFDYLKNQHMYLRPIKDIARISFTQNSTIEDFKILVAQIRKWMAENQKQA